MVARNLFSEVLRILTPDELSVLTTVTEGEQFFSLTEMMEQEFVVPRLRSISSSNGKAKILPFTKDVALDSLPKSTEVRGDEAKVLAKEVAEELKSGDINPEEVNSVRVTAQSELLQEPDVSEEGQAKVLDLGDFIIREKQRLKDSQKKLKEQEVVGLYRKSASVDLEQEKLLKNDLSKSANGGILVNKKQL